MERVVSALVPLRPLSGIGGAGRSEVAGTAGKVCSCVKGKAAKASPGSGGRACPRPTAQPGEERVFGSAPFALKTRADMSLICLVSVVVLGVFWVVLWVLWFGSFALFGQAHFLTLLMRIRHGDLCLSAHTAPLPVQKKTQPGEGRHSV